MEDITNSLSALNIKTQKVLYYSVAFDYKDIINLVSETLSNDKSTLSYTCTKMTDYFELLNGKLSDDDKMNISNQYYTHIDKLKSDDKFIIYNDVIYMPNSEFHITTLFTGGKVHIKSSEMETQLEKKVLVKINKLGISSNFITMGIESIKLEDGVDIFYYGNDIKHITIALNKTGKKIFPKDSYTALSDGKIYELEYIIEGTTCKVVQ